MADVPGFDAWQRMMEAALREGPTAFRRWTDLFTAESRDPATGAAATDWVEQWYRAMGVVPRARYLDLLERNDVLQRKLREAEETIARLRSTLEARGALKEDTRQMLDLWQSTADEVLRAQQEWLRLWGERPASAEDEVKGGDPGDDGPEEYDDPGNDDQ